MLCFAFPILSLSAPYPQLQPPNILAHEGVMRIKSGQIYEENLNIQSILR